MPAGTADLLIEEGATFQHRFLWQDADGNALSLAGHAALMQIRASVDAEDVLLQLSTGNGRIVLNAEPGSIDLIIAAVDTEDLPWTEARYDLQVSIDGVVTRLAQGRVIVARAVTR